MTLTDVYGHLNNQGTLTIRTTRGAASGTIAVADAATSILITYPAGTTGEDMPTLSFSQPGIAPVNGGLGFKVTFPTVGTLARFDTYPAGPFDEPIKLGINAVTPLTVLPRSTSGATITVADGCIVEYDTSGLTVLRTNGVAITSGANVGAATGRFVMQVVAKTIPGY